MRTPREIASFDSASGMLRALARFLHGRDFPALGVAPALHLPGSVLGSAAGVLNALPDRARERIYAWSGWAEAVPERMLRDLDAERISRWATGLYPERSYPAVVVGSANGSMVHLCAALGIPWLPQTFLVPVRHGGIHPDEPAQEMDAMAAAGRMLLGRNPDLQLHHMHDANQDRLMITHMTYFRVKRLRLGETYERFIRERLEPGGTILICECRLTWPVTKLGERHFFQHGAHGGLGPEESMRGSERITAYLARYGSHRACGRHRSRTRLCPRRSGGSSRPCAPTWNGLPSSGASGCSG